MREIAPTYKAHDININNYALPPILKIQAPFENYEYTSMNYHAKHDNPLKE